MTNAHPRLLLVLASLMVVIGFPVAGKWARRHAGPRCAFDGLTIVPIYGARIVDPTGEAHRFCCVRCAGLWLARRGDRPATVFVTNEAGGLEIDARSAVFVRSAVATRPITGNHVHVVRERADAEDHARAFGGWVLKDDERPFP